MSIAICPGTFDPITNGHIDIIQRAANMFDKVVVGIFDNPAKTPMFNLKERIEMIENSVVGYNIEICYFEGLLAEYAASRDITAVVRGLRAVSDFEYEFQMALTNRKLNPSLETVFLPSKENYTYLSSSMVKTVAMNGGVVDSFVPQYVAKELYTRYLNKKW